MDVILAAADAGRLTSMEELRDKLDYGKVVSKQAIRSSLKYLQFYGFVESEKSGLFTLYKPTPQAYSTFRSGP